MLRNPGSSGAAPGGASPLGPSGPPPPPSRPVLAGALVIVAVLAAAALFASGFSLGERAGGGLGAGGAALQPLVEAYTRITTQYVGEADPEKLVEAAIRGMFETLDDPYSSYLSPDEYAQGLEIIDGEFEGIGAEIAGETPAGAACELAGPDCRLRVLRVIEDSPAERAGLLADDAIVAVDGRLVEGETLDDVITRVRGPRGSRVTLSVRRDEQTLDLPVERDVIRSQDVRSEVLADGQVAYLRVAGFTGSTAEDFRAALAAQVNTNVERIVLDLRDDPGGSVDAAVSIASQFLASGPVFWESRADGTADAVHARGGGVAVDPRIRVVVLVDAGTASASEIVAGALQDTGRGTLVGENTFGKGTIQEWQLLPGDGGGMRLSVAKWLTPGKKWVHGTGLQPDLEVADEPGGDDAQLDAAVRLLLTDPSPASPSPGSPAPGSPAAGSPVATAQPVP